MRKVWWTGGRNEVGGEKERALRANLRGGGWGDKGLTLSGHIVAVNLNLTDWWAAHIDVQGSGLNVASNGTTHSITVKFTLP